MGAFVYCVAAALLLSAAAGTGIAIQNAQRSVSQVKRMHEVPWVGGEVSIREPGTFALYRVQPGYADMPRTPMPSMWIYAPNGLPLQINYTPSQADAKAGASGAAKADPAPTGGDQTEVPISSRSIKVGDITAEQVGTVDIGTPGTYEVRFTMPMRVGDALLVSPPVDRFVPPIVTSLKLAVGFEALGLLILLGTLMRHLLTNRGKTLTGMVLAGAHRVASGQQRTFDEVAETFGAPATQTRRRHRARRVARPVIDLRTTLPPPPVPVVSTEASPPAASVEVPAPRPTAPTGRSVMPSPVPPAPRPASQRAAPASPWGPGAAPRRPQVLPDITLTGFPTPRPGPADLPPRAPRRRTRAIPVAHVGRSAAPDAFAPSVVVSLEHELAGVLAVPRRDRSVARDADRDLSLDLRTGAPAPSAGAPAPSAGVRDTDGVPSDAARSRVVRVPRPRLDRTR